MSAQINTEQVLNIGRNALYFEDYVLSIQYFNQVIKAKPYLAEPYFYRAVAKINLDDYQGAEQDCNKALEINPFIVDAYQVRGIARQTLKKYKEAVNDYDMGLKYLPEEKVFLINKAMCQEDLKNYDGSVDTYERLLKLYPNFDKAYLARAQLMLAKGDTASALTDVNKCIELNKTIPASYVIRSEIAMRHDNDYQSALNDMNEAIKLEPHYAGYFINRGFMKYKLEDYFGAMADYDYAVELEPTNVTAHFNRGLLNVEVSENDKAIADFSYVLRSDPNNFLARYNRALLYYKTGQYDKAITDYDAVLEKYPDFEAGLFARSECKRRMGDMAGGERDYNRSRALSNKKKKIAEYDPDKDEQQTNEEVESESAVMNKFNTLLTVETDSKITPKYENKTRGRIQDNNYQIDPEPMFFLSYYDVSKKLRETTNYIKDLNEVNETRMLPFTLMLTNAEVRLSADDINRHFSSIEYYNGLISTSQPRSIDYFARAMDLLMVRNPEAAIADLDKAIGLSEKFALAYFARAYAKYLKLQIGDAEAPTDNLGKGGNAKEQALLAGRKNVALYGEIIADFDAALKYSPKNVYAMYNKGNVYMLLQDNTAAISAYTAAIAVKPDFGEAYYNRGLVYLRLGNKDKGLADLSKAGELGILPSYNVLKRMSR
ncbi:MAG: tetratricopeptide repeat protein [Muribaculaceae bacterium]